MQLLAAQSPESLRTKDAKGMLPLFVAAAGNGPLDVMFFLATTWPESIYGNGRRTGQP
jgi:hypothetical protein